MQIVTIVGARPQFIKAAVVSKAITQYNTCHIARIQERILHTGQHFDANMSEQFFHELQIPAPQWHLGCSSDVTEIKQAIVNALQSEAIDYILVYGDTNSTLAGALAAEELHIPLIHVEAGLRSFNNEMREEYNRIETDKHSALLFCPTHTAVRNLQNENIQQGVYYVGDVMQDAAIHYKEIAQQQSHILQDLQLTEKSFYLATIHRAETTNDINKLQNILVALDILAQNMPVILPLHPRTRQVISNNPQLAKYLQHITCIDPIGYLDMVMLESAALLIFTDSGGVQKEAYFHRTPCVTLREETEWEETINAGWNILAGTNTEKIIAATHHHFEQLPINEYGAGHTATQIIDIISHNA